MQDIEMRNISKFVVYFTHGRSVQAWKPGHAQECSSWIPTCVRQ